MDFTIEQAIEIAKRAHSRQLRRGREPYFFHCQRVADCLIYKESKIAAILHDVVEDTNLDLDDLEMMGVPRASLVMIDLLSKRKDESSEDYMERLLNSGNVQAIWIKKYDALDNANFTDEDKVWAKEWLGLDPEKEIVKYKERAELCDNALLSEVA